MDKIISQQTETIQSPPIQQEKLIKNKLWILLAIILFIITLILSYFLLNQKQTINNQKIIKKQIEKEVIQEESKIISCTRTTRLENSPQYDRALSLIQQRVKEKNDWWNKYGETEQSKKDNQFIFFPPELTNCIKIEEKKSEDMSGLEGYFIFNNEGARDNYYPIVISSDYAFADDITTALLLSHEITHVQQYIDSLNNEDTLSCLESEIEAFMSQLALYIRLNSEEIDSVYYRIQNDKGLHSQLQMINIIIEAGKEGDCFSKYNVDKDYLVKVSECQDEYMRKGLKEIIYQNDHYKEQCEL